MDVLARLDAIERYLNDAKRFAERDKSRSTAAYIASALVEIDYARNDNAGAVDALREAAVLLETADFATSAADSRRDRWMTRYLATTGGR